MRDDGLKLMTENIEDSIRYIQTAVGRLARIIDALLRLSRAGRVEYQWQTFDLAAIVRKIVDALHDTITAKKAEVTVGELPPAWGDPTAVEQIFANLIGNAVQYLDPARPGRIEVGSADSPPSGSDAGLPCLLRQGQRSGHSRGIPPARLHRLQPAPRECGPREGIGLALVRRMVERHGGRIWLESAAGVGTTFFVALPARAPAGGPAAGRWNGRPQPRSQEENNPHGSRADLDRPRRGRRRPRQPGRAQPANGPAWPTASTASRTARRPSTSFTAKGAYAAGRNASQPMLLLLDIKMPRVDGVEVLRQLKSDPQTALIPVIMLTTTDDPREIQRCYELGCSVYITKPVDYQAFVEAIKRLGLFLQVVRIPDTQS